MFIHIFLHLLHMCFNTFHHLLLSGTLPDATSPFQPAKKREWAYSEPASDPRETVLGAWLPGRQPAWLSSSPSQKQWRREAQTSPRRSPPPDFLPVLQTTEMVDALELSMPALPWVSVCFADQGGNARHANAGSFRVKMLSQRSGIPFSLYFL